MKNPAECVKDLLVTAGVGAALDAGTSGWRIGCGRLPDAPVDTAVIVNTVSGLNPFPQFLLNQPSIHVAVRGAKNGYQATYTQAYKVVKALLGMSSTVVQGDMYRSCIQIGDIAFLGFDDNTRPLFAVNFRFIVEPAAETGDLRVSIT